MERSAADSKSHWQPRGSDELSKQLGSYFGLPIDSSAKVGRLKAIANALSEGDLARAQIATVLLGVPDPPGLSKGARTADAMIKFICDLHWSGLIKTDWNPDERPRWPAGAPDSQGGQFAPESDSDECGRNATIRRRWELREGREWPRDAQGRRYDVHHIRPKADGGTDDLDNIEPKPHDEHMREHMRNGDFARWAREAWARRKAQLGFGSQNAKPPKSPPKETPKSRLIAPRENENSEAAEPETSPNVEPVPSPEEPIAPDELFLEELPGIIPE